MTTTAITHGASRYSNQGCRCATCRAGHAQRQREARHRRSQNPQTADRAGHGKDATYGNYGCRCAACTRAHTDVMRKRRERRAEATR